VLSDLVDRNVEITAAACKEPGPAFRKDFDHYPNLIRGMERILCPRVHLKSVIVDGQFCVYWQRQSDGRRDGHEIRGSTEF